MKKEGDLKWVSLAQGEPSVFSLGGIERRKGGIEGGWKEKLGSSKEL